MSMATKKPKAKKGTAKKPTKATTKATAKAKATQRPKAPTPINAMPRKPPPAGVMIWHNPVPPHWFDQPPDYRGFRVYKEASATADGMMVCDCGWAPWIGPHYRPKAKPGGTTWWTEGHRAKSTSWADDAAADLEAKMAEHGLPIPQRR
jgi:hypothetical protein